MAFEEEFDRYLELSWTAWSKSVIQAQKQLTTWLFTFCMVQGSPAASVTQRRGEFCCGVIVPLIAFVVGILSLLIWATLIYYLATLDLRGLRPM